MNVMFLFSSVGLLRTSDVRLLAKQLRTMEWSYVKGQLVHRVQLAGEQAEVVMRRRRIRRNQVTNT